jgi:hypothetical protein
MAVENALPYCNCCCKMFYSSVPRLSSGKFFCHQCYKALLLVTEALSKQAILFEPGKSFQPSLIFARKAGAFVCGVDFRYFLSKNWSSLWDCTVRVIPSLACKY